MVEAENKRNRVGIADRSNKGKERVGEMKTHSWSLEPDNSALKA